MLGSAETWQRSVSFTRRTLSVSPHRGHELRSAAYDARETEVEAGIRDLLALISFEPLISSALSYIVESAGRM